MFVADRSTPAPMMGTYRRSVVPHVFVQQIGQASEKTLALHHKLGRRKLPRNEQNKEKRV